jgi:hypothetical protein
MHPLLAMLMSRLPFSLLQHNRPQPKTTSTFPIFGVMTTTRVMILMLQSVNLKTTENLLQRPMMMTPTLTTMIMMLSLTAGRRTKITKLEQMTVKIPTTKRMTIMMMTTT